MRLSALILVLCACAPAEDRLDPGAQHSPSGLVAPAAEAGPSDRPYLRLLGTAQDGGLPQIGCVGPHCTAAREDPARARMVVSLLLVDPRTSSRWLFEATPDLPRQVARAHAWGDLELARSGRPALVQGILLTHAHMGHYTGLLHLGREAYGGASVPVLGTPRLLDYLGSNGPWSLAFTDGHLSPAPLDAYVRHALAPDLFVTPIPVPHREEFSDTVGWLIEGPERRVLFLPDIDKWEAWDRWGHAASDWDAWSRDPASRERRLEHVLSRVDVALLDGTFFADGEIPGRSMADIPHPFIEESLARLVEADPATRAKVWFIHLNHTNPATQVDGEAALRVRTAGCDVAREGQLIEL